MTNIIKACQTGDVNYLFNNNFDPNLVDEYGSSLLHIACERGNQTVVELLLQMNNININIIDEHYNNTPIMTAVNHARDNGSFDIVWLMLHIPGINLSHRNWYNIDLIDELIVVDNLELVRYIYQYLAHIHTLSPARNLLTAIQCDNLDTIQYLLVNSPLTTITGNHLIKFCQTNIKQGPQVVKIFNLFTTKISDVNQVDDKQLAAINYLCINDVPLLIKTLLLTGKVTMDQHRMKYKVTRHRVIKIIDQYFTDPQVMDKWTKELDVQNGLAADLYVLYFKYRFRLNPNNSNINRLFTIFNNINDDCLQILCLRMCGSDRLYIPSMYIKLACQQYNI